MRNTVEIDRHKSTEGKMYIASVSWLLKLGFTPLGGSNAGPFKIALSTAGGNTMTAKDQ